MFASLYQHIIDFWQQPQYIHLNDALPWLLAIVIISIVFLPVPIETLMFASETLAKHWHYSVITLFAVFLLGTYIGLQIGYGIGYWLEHMLEPWLLRKQKITPEEWSHKLRQFRRFRAVILMFGLFIPGFRHLVGILAGASKMRYSAFCVFALIGAIIWTGTFSLGGWLLGR